MGMQPIARGPTETRQMPPVMPCAREKRKQKQPKASAARRKLPNRAGTVRTPLARITRRKVAAKTAGHPERLVRPPKCHPAARRAAADDTASIRKLGFARPRRADLGRLLAGHFHGRGARRHPAGDLRCDQKGRNHRRHAYQPEKLIHRKHRLRPQKRRRQKARSVRRLRGLLIAGQNLIRVSRPGNREQRENRNNGQRFHAGMVVFDCGQKRQRLAHFMDEAENNRGCIRSWRSGATNFCVCGITIDCVALP
jgi:hypothetical protein